MSRELIVHIGLPKTGSSAIQAVLAKKREALLAHGVDYLPISDYWTALAGRTSSGNGLALARSMLLKHDPNYIDAADARVQGSLREVAASESPQILLSSEFFSFASEAGWHSLKELAESLGRDLRIVAGVRNPQDMISASLVQLIRNHGLTDISQERIKKLYVNHRSLKYFAFFAQIESLTAARLHVLSYDRAREAGRLLHHFFAEIGIEARDIGQDSEDLKANVTPSPEAIAFAYDCNVRKIKHPMITALLQRHPSTVPWTMIPGELAAEIDRFFQEDHRMFVDKFTTGSFFAAPCANYVDIARCDFHAVPLLRSASLNLRRSSRK